MAHNEHENPPAFTGKGRLKDSRYGVEITEKLGQVSLTGNATVAVFQYMVDIGMAGAADSRVFEAVRRMARPSTRRLQRLGRRSAARDEHGRS